MPEVAGSTGTAGFRFIPAGTLRSGCGWDVRPSCGEIFRRRCGECSLGLGLAEWRFRLRLELNIMLHPSTVHLCISRRCTAEKWIFNAPVNQSINQSINQFDSSVSSIILCYHPSIIIFKGQDFVWLLGCLFFFFHPDSLWDPSVHVAIPELHPHSGWSDFFFFFSCFVLIFLSAVPEGFSSIRDVCRRHKNSSVLRNSGIASAFRLVGNFFLSIDPARLPPTQKHLGNAELRNCGNPESHPHSG